ncbi:hypothetical protein N0V93_001202 [Gnomoniopsis smithogilvyi]|uniref:Major facilitator superfamily (MFS) profile domain-containing protein n=1 Tax=Gnomoniopsis smithogilvyi TaxID=1191159 RepID=A0A9W9D1F7_9PEZI|nr:hypothetical protein N0V93_001202 [Gnomoniopsis smithogilvyi]
MPPDLKCEGTIDATDTPPTTPQEYTVFNKNAIRIIVLLCAVAGFFSPFSAFTYFPAIDYIGKDLGVSLQLMDLTITMFLVVQGIAPAILGDLADQVGRRPVYLLVLVVYFAASVGLALQRSYPALLVLRMVQSFGSSGTIALGIMVVADLAPPHDRGRYIGAMLSGPNSGPSFGPVLGGILAELTGWPWIFWLLAIMGGASLFPFFVLFPETCRNIVGNGSLDGGGRLNKPLAHVLSPMREGRAHDKKPTHRLQRFPNPFKCLRIVARRHDALLLVSNALFYLTYSCVQASLATLVMQHYGLNALQAGLCYLPYGVASIIASYLVGKVLDLDYRITARHEGITIDKIAGDALISFPIERARIRSVWYFIFCDLPHAECRPPPDRNRPRKRRRECHALPRAAAGVVCLQPLFDTIGVGWAFTTLGLLSGLSVPMLLVLRSLGPKWRGCVWN